MPADRGHDLLDRYLDGGLDAAEAAEFRALLLADARLAAELLAAAADEARFRMWASAQPAPREPARRRARGRVAAFAVALAACVAGVWWAWPAGPGAGAGTGTGERLAAVVRADGCAWDGSGVPGDGPVAGTEYRLTEGVAEFRTPLGVRAVVEGPAAFAFHAADRLALARGRVFCDVPAAAVGFRVETPAGRVVDLGTRFGVEVEATGKTGVYVYQGRVDVEVAGPVRLAGGEAVAVAPGGPPRRLPFADRFLTTAGLIDEPFDYPLGPLGDAGGWVQVGDARRVPVGRGRFVYPGLAPPRGKVLDVNSHGVPTAPVARRWPAVGFTSAVVHLDDDFPKSLRVPKPTPAAAGLFRVGAGASGVWVVVRPAGNAEIQVGLRCGARTAWAEPAVPAFAVHLIAVERRSNVCRLWVDPPAGALGAATPPAPGTELTAPPPDAPAALQVGDPANPGYCWWTLEDLRVGPAWADVTPAANSNRSAP